MSKLTTENFWIFNLKKKIDTLFYNLITHKSYKILKIYEAYISRCWINIENGKITNKKKKNILSINDEPIYEYCLQILKPWLLNLTF